MDSNQKSNIVLRQAREEDCDEIFKMSKELLEDVKVDPEKRICSLEDLKRNMFGNSKVSACVLAEDIKEDGSHATIGYAIYCSMHDTVYGRTMWLSSMYVKEEYRGKGVGTILMKRVAACAATDRCNAVLWVVSGTDDIAQRFYKRLGATNLTAEENLFPFVLKGQAFKDLAAHDTN